MEAKTKASIVFIGVIFLIVGYTFWYGRNVEQVSTTTRIPLTSEQIVSLNTCSEKVHDSVQVLQTNSVCYPKKENKHNIVLLATTPKSGSYITQQVYEQATGIQTYTPYIEDDLPHIAACNFQTGPWKLYCRANPQNGSCAYQHPPPWTVPYFVLSNYPVNAKVCHKFGYPLPRHEKVIHFVRNPVDNIEEWVRYDFSKLTERAWNDDIVQKYTDQYVEWAEFWKDYYAENPNIPSLWLRYEDFCICTKTAMHKLLTFADAHHHIDDDILDQVLAVNPCTESKEIGRGLHPYTKSQLQYVIKKTAHLSEEFKYTELLESFSENLKHASTNSSIEAFQRALWPELGLNAHPTDEYCEDLIATVRGWGNTL